MSEPNYRTKKWFSEKLLSIEMEKIKGKMNMPVYLGLSILEISKTLMYEFWYDYIKPKYQDNAKLCYMDTDSFIKGTRKHVIKQRLKFSDYKDCLLNNKIILKSQQRFKSEAHNVYTEEVNKIALSSNDDKRLQRLIELHRILMDQVLGKYVKHRCVKQSKYKMINSDNYTNENKTEHNSNWA